MQLIAADYRSHSVDDYKGLAERLSAPVREAADPEDWETQFMLQTVHLNLDGYGKEVESLCVEFNAWARSAVEAAASRERIIRLLRKACASDLVFGQASG